MTALTDLPFAVIPVLVTTLTDLSSHNGSSDHDLYCTLNWLILFYGSNTLDYLDWPIYLLQWFRYRYSRQQPWLTHFPQGLLLRIWMSSTWGIHSTWDDGEREAKQHNSEQETTTNNKQHVYSEWVSQLCPSVSPAWLAYLHLVSSPSSILLLILSHHTSFYYLDPFVSFIAFLRLYHIFLSAILYNCCSLSVYM